MNGLWVWQVLKYDLKTVCYVVGRFSGQVAWKTKLVGQKNDSWCVRSEKTAPIGWFFVGAVKKMTCLSGVKTDAFRGLRGGSVVDVAVSVSNQLPSSGGVRKCFILAHAAGCRRVFFLLQVN